MLKSYVSQSTAYTGLILLEKTPATATVALLTLASLGDVTTNRNNPVCCFITQGSQGK